MIIREVLEKDYGQILALNIADEEVLSPMDEMKLRYFVKNAHSFLVVCEDDQVLAFIIVLKEGLADYGSENYRFFVCHHKRFLYVDRIVIKEGFRQRGWGKLLYQEVFKEAEVGGYPVVCVEVDLIPYNGASLVFHQKLGFKEVGVQFVRNQQVKVSLQEHELCAEK